MAAVMYGMREGRLEPLSNTAGHFFIPWPCMSQKSHKLSRLHRSEVMRIAQGFHSKAFKFIILAPSLH
ncbi:MAG: hypothetical protein ABS92_13050 [Thiobacillus sp. SCN 63-374]|nr:MAG: hypothetical protein ABS92_13050 [Thiobacillus sp. SCN 63-374]